MTRGGAIRPIGMTMDWLPQVSILVVEPVAAGRGGERRRDVWDLWCQICIEKGGDGYWALCGYAEKSDGNSC
jgi:hypothetical protein